MKIFIIFCHLPEKEQQFSTYERATRDRFLTNILNKNNYDVSLCFLTHQKKCFVLNNDSSKPIFFPIDESCKNKQRKLYTSELLAKKLLLEKPDLVIFKGMGYILPYFLYKKGCLPKKVAFIIGGNDKDILLPVSSYIFTEFQYQNNFFLRKNIACSVLNKFLDYSDFLENDNKIYDIISIGDLSSRKNHTLLFPLGKKYSIIIIGDGPLKKEYEEIIKSQKLNIILTGKIPRTEIPKYISQSRLMVHPSKSEGFPRSFAEAFACGVPVVALNKAIKEKSFNNIAGRLIEDKNIATEVEYILSNNEIINNYSKNAQLIAKNNFTSDIVAKQFLNSIREIEKLKPINIYSTKYKMILTIRYYLWLIDLIAYQIYKSLKNQIWSFIKK